MTPTDEQVPDGSTDFSREDAADVTVGVGHEISGLKLNDASVSTDYYDLSEDECSITIDKDYLATLSDGTQEFAIILADSLTTPTTVLWDVVISGKLESDFDRSDPDDVEITVSDATITGVKLGDDAVDASNITIASGSHAVTIKKAYLATLSNGVKEFTVMASTAACLVCEVTITGDHTATFDRSSAADVAVTVADSEITGLKYQDAVVDASNYALSNSDHTITIKKEYLADLSDGDKTFKIMEGTAFDTVVVTVSGSGSASFSKAAPADITIAVTDAEITGLKIGGTNVNTDNYTIAEGAHSITIDDDYLGGLANGDKTFKILLEDETEVTYVITVGD